MKSAPGASDAEAEIRSHAQMFGWSCYHDRHRHQDTFVCGPNMVEVNYRKDGMVNVGRRFTFFRINSPKLEETTGCRHKRSAIVSWLVSLGN
ncbi:hypothetical protein [Mycobacterium intracellulare]|uniref:hypothetical protein n=1 Tax=Mycobacterium intracellulare TaxID=1767 RepID=UPI00192814C1|nr:hypothetical protein [Mycobacterium intracellulare]